MVKPHGLDYHEQIGAGAHKNIDFPFLINGRLQYVSFPQGP